MVILVILVTLFSYSIDNSLKKPLNAKIVNKELVLDGFNNPFNPSKTIIPINNIEKISLELPPLIVLNNDGGGQNGNKIYGTENIKGLGYIDCYIENSEKKYIFLKTTKKKYIINFLNTKKTLEIFNQLKS